MLQVNFKDRRTNNADKIEQAAIEAMPEFRHLTVGQRCLFVVAGDFGAYWEYNRTKWEKVAEAGLPKKTGVYLIRYQPQNDEHDIGLALMFFDTTPGWRLGSWTDVYEYCEIPK